MSVELTFSDAEVPDLTRAVVKSPNPFIDAIEVLTAGMVDGRSAVAKEFIVPETDVKKAGRQLTLAGNACGVTVRRVVTPGEDGAVVVKFWTVAKIVRTPKVATF